MEKWVERFNRLRDQVGHYTADEITLACFIMGTPEEPLAPLRHNEMAMKNLQSFQEGIQRIDNGNCQRKGLKMNVKNNGESANAATGYQGEKRKCLYCNGDYHERISDCPELKAIRERRARETSLVSDTDKETPATEEPPAIDDLSDECDEIWVATTDIAMAAPDVPAPFLIDSGASRHMVNDPKMFKSITPESHPIKVANGQVVTSTGIGTAELPDGTGKVVRLTNALLVPDLSYNLISVAALATK